MTLIPDRVGLALVIACIAMVFSTLALLVVLLREPREQHTPVEGISGLDDALHRGGRDMPTAELPRPRPGALYTGGHRRKGAGRWLAHLGRTHARRNEAAQRYLP